MAERGGAGWIALAIVLSLDGPRSALADDRASAEEQVRQGLAQYEAGEYAAAAASLEKAYTVLAQPRLLFNIARAYERGGDRARAIANYERYLQQEGGEPELQERARQGLERLREPKPGAATPAPPPGPSAAPTASAPPAPSGPPHGEHPDSGAPSYALPTAMMVIGGAAVATGVGFGVWASSTASDARGTTDPVSKPDLRDAAQGRAVVADVLFVAGALTFGTGLVLRLFVLPKSHSGASARIERALAGSF